MGCELAILRITDGTVAIDLLDGAEGIWLDAWNPALPGAKAGGRWQDPPHGDGRTLQSWEWTNIVDVFTVHIKRGAADDAIAKLRDVFALLVKAANFRTSRWQTEPVWIEAKALRETNARYALIESWTIPGHNNPYAEPFVGASETVFQGLELTVEHEPWEDGPPGQPCAVERYETGCFPYYPEFDGANSVVDCGSDPTIDDIPAGGQFTADMWARPTSYGEGNQGYFIGKGTGWTAGFIGGNIAFRVYAGGGNSTALVAYTVDSQWHHYAFMYDDAGARTAQIWVDGVQIAVGGAAAGVYTPDAASNLFIGASNAAAANSFGGDIGWTRVSDSIRWAAAFMPPPRCKVPAPDANSMMIVIFDGESPTTYDLTINGNDGTITGATWDCDCDYSTEVD